MPIKSTTKKAPAARKTVKKAPAKKTTAAKKPAAKKAPAKKTSAAKMTAKKPAAKKAVAKKTVAKKKPAAKKPAAKKASAKKAGGKSAKKSKGRRGLPEQLRDEALHVLDGRKAADILSVDLRGKSAVADYAIVATGNSNRQLSAMAHHLGEAFAKLGVKRVRVEGAGSGDWVLIDAGDLIIHLFRPEVRSFYNLEALWDAASVSRA